MIGKTLLTGSLTGVLFLQAYFSEYKNKHYIHIYLIIKYINTYLHRLTYNSGSL